MNDILDLVRRSAAVPSMPQVAARFLEIIQDPDFEYRDVVEVLSADPAMTGEILRLANSPLFGVARKITSLAQALTLLGLKRVRSLVLGRYIVDSIDKKRPPNVDMTYYWRRSLTTAVLASRLAEAVTRKLREEAFTAGLLADIGIVILDETVPELFGPVAREYRPLGRDDLWELETQILSATHGRVSAFVLEEWQLPDTVCKAVSGHAEPESAHEEADTLGGTLRAAEKISKFLCEPTEDLDEVARCCAQAVERIGFTPAVPARILDEIGPQIGEFAAILRIEPIPLQNAEQIARKLEAQAGAYAS